VIERIREWFRIALGTELPCGCIATDGRGARVSDDTTVINREHETVRSIEYRNCTKHENEWEFTIKCDHCGSLWEKRERAGPRIDYGDEHRDAGLELKAEHRGRFVNHKEVPVLLDKDGEQ